MYHAGEHIHYNSAKPCYQVTYTIERDVSMDPKYIWLTTDGTGFFSIREDNIHREEDCMKLKFLQFMESL